VRNALLLAATFLPSTLRLALWRALGFSVGRGCRVAPFSIIVADAIEIGDGAIVEPLSFVYAPLLLHLGARSRVASFVRIIGRGPARLAAQSFVGLGCLIDTTGGFHLGRRSQLGPRGVYYSHGASGLTYSQRFPERTGPLRIGDDVWVGMAAVVYPAVTIGDRAIVFAGLVVAADVAAETAIAPAANALRRFPVRMLRVGVSDELVRGKMEALLRDLAQDLGGVIEDLPGGNRRASFRGWSVLLRVERGAVVETSTDRVLWALDDDATSAHAALFLFSMLEIRGAPSAESERVAEWLCRHGVHFAAREA